MRLVALLCIVLLLAGCSGVPSETTFLVPDDAPATADTHTGNGYDLRIQVTDHNGTPQAGAAVVVFTMNDAFGGSVEAGATAGEDGARAVAFWEAEFTSYNTVAGLRTNAEGWARVDLEPNRMVHVAAGDVAGFTTEVRTNVAVGAGGASGSMQMALYPDTISYVFDVSLANNVGTGGLQEGRGQAYEIPFSDDSVFSQAYRNRIYNLDAAITWTNGFEQGADLHVGIGDADDPRWIGRDQQQTVNDGTHEETVSVSSSDLNGHRADLAEVGYHAHVMTDWASLGFNGVDVQIEVTASLKGSNIRIQ